MNQKNEEATSILSLRNVTKLFGINKPAAREMMEQGAGKNEILRKTGVTLAVNNVSFEVKQGEIFVLIGLSGSGKSTVIRCINMLQRATSGEIFFDGNNIMTMNSKEILEMRRTKMSMVFQGFGLMSHRNVLGNVGYGLEVRGVSRLQREEKAMELIELVGLSGWEHKSISDLSGGMQQRVGIARALCNDPDILLMDEPFSALDPLARRDMQFELLSIQKKLNKSIVFITHDIDEALKMGDKVGIMRDGVIEQQGSPEDLILHPVNDYVVNFLDNIDRTKLLTAKHIMITPTCLIREHADPVLAIKEMRANEVSTAYVVNQKMRFCGIITLNDALGGRNQAITSLSSLVIRDVPEVHQDTLISDIMSIASSTPFPLPVVDDEGRLKGIVSRAAILATLSQSSINEPDLKLIPDCAEPSAVL